MNEQELEVRRRFGDILNLPHPVSQRHQPMPLRNRAAQFAPFAALTGYEEMLEQAREHQGKEERRER